VKIVRIAGFGPLVRDVAASQRFYRDTLGIPFEMQQGDYIATDRFPGCNHFGLWPLADAARSCFGGEEWPSDLPVPHAGIEYEMESPEAVAEGERELEAAGHRILRRTAPEPWGQITARLLSPEGLLVGLSYAPWAH